MFMMFQSNHGNVQTGSPADPVQNAVTAELKRLSVSFMSVSVFFVSDYFPPCISGCCETVSAHLRKGAVLKVQEAGPYLFMMFLSVHGNVETGSLILPIPSAKGTGESTSHSQQAGDRSPFLLLHIAYFLEDHFSGVMNDVFF